LIQVKRVNDKRGTMQNLRLCPWQIEQGERVLEKSEWEITWSNLLSVGDSEMDDEHRQFIARVNELNRSIVEIEDKATVAHAVDLMLIEAARHFKHEEELLARWNYPDTAAHAARHAALTAQFDRAVKEFAETDISFVWALKGLHIKQLLVEHLLNEDMKYRDFLRAQGTSAPGA
jgi:hemerythrin-like metal-binding protein